MTDPGAPPISLPETRSKNQDQMQENDSVACKHLDHDTNNKNDNKMTEGNLESKTYEANENVDSDESLEEMPAALDLSISPDKSYLDIDTTFDHTFDDSLVNDENAELDLPPPNTEALFETPFKDELAANSDSFLNAVPPMPSPRKTSNIALPSSRAVSGSLKIMKRRKIGSPSSTVSEQSTLLQEPDSPTTHEPPKSPTSSQPLRVTPSKSRSFSTPLINAKQRTPSLKDKPIPELTPPALSSPLRSTKNMSARSVSHSFVSPISSFKNPVHSPQSSPRCSTFSNPPDSPSKKYRYTPPQQLGLTILDQEPLNSNSTSERSPEQTDQKHQIDKKRSASYQLAPPESGPPLDHKSPIKKSSGAPLPTVPVKLITTTCSVNNTLNAPRAISLPTHHPHYQRKQNDPKTAALYTKESLIDQEIMKIKKLIDTANLAQSYQASNQDDKLSELEANWRDVAQKGAFYLYTEAKAKVERMGGMKEFLRRKKEDEESLQQMQAFDEDSVDFDDMTAEEQERFIALKEEYEDQMKLDKRNRGADEDEEDPDEFTMKYMLKSLKVDYNLVFPDGYDSDEE